MSEWVGTVSTAVVGVVGGVLTWLSGKQGRDHAERLAGDRFDHERIVAADARNQARIEASYLRLLGLVDQASAWAQSVKPMMDTIPPQTVAAGPTVKQQIDVQTVVGAFGSEAVQGLYEDWRRRFREIVYWVGLIDLEDNDTRGGPYDEPRLHLRDARPKERAARNALAKQINEELRG